MLQRGFAEIDLRTMLGQAIAYFPISCMVAGSSKRTIVITRGRIVVEPDFPEGPLVVIAAYPL